MILYAIGAISFCLFLLMTYVTAIETRPEAYPHFAAALFLAITAYCFK
jgi:hypothetical protein